MWNFFIIFFYPDGEVDHVRNWNRSLKTDFLKSTSILGSIGRVYFLDTAGVENFYKIALSYTVKKIEGILALSFKAKSENGILCTHLPCIHTHKVWKLLAKYFLSYCKLK